MIEAMTMHDSYTDGINIFYSPFSGLGIGGGIKEVSREGIHEEGARWMDEVRMKGGAGLWDIAKEVFKKRQELMGKIMEQLLKEKFYDELELTFLSARSRFIISQTTILQILPLS